MTHFRLIMGSLLLCVGSGAANARTESLMSQTALMPEDFKAHFFNSPLSAKVTLNGKKLGDAMIVLTEDNQTRIVQFTDVSDSEYTEEDRQRWLQAFSTLVPLGECTRDCPDGLMAVEYSLSDASLALLTPAAMTSKDLWYSLPEGGDSGIILNNQFNASGSEEQSTLSWNGGLDAAIGNWSLSSQFQQDQSRAQGQDMLSRHAITSLYAQREYEQNFLRAGLFMPDSQGLLRQPYLPGGGISTLAGVMVGSSDTRMKEGGTPSLYPVYVTANREGVAEIYRNGSLINSQPVVPGLQVLDTTSLPMGIYEVDIRVLEDGRETSRTTETINKPYSWRNPDQRLRYNLFFGQQRTLWNSDPDSQNGDPAAGASLNYLLYPRLTLGMAVQKTGDERQAGGSIDWQLADALQLYGNVWRSSVTGYGFDTQAIWTHKQGNVALSHSRSWYRQDDELYQYDSRPSQQNTTSFSSTWRFSGINSITGRLSHSSRNSGVGIDIGFNTRTMIGKTAVNWRLAGFDRPYGDGSSLRNRGVSLSASFSLGSESRSGNISLGSRTDTQGERDFYTSASVNQQWGENSPIRSTLATLTGDRHGVGVSASNQFDTALAQGSFWAQSSTQDSRLSGGINTGSLIAFGKGEVAISKLPSYNQGGGVIVNVDSDEENTKLLAFYPGGQKTLSAGRNFVPVDAWKPGTIQLDFAGTDAPALKIEPEYLSYQHIRGGVNAYNVRVMKTVTVMGRLVNSKGEALGGASVVNHASRTMSESDGLFTLEMQKSIPVLNVEQRSGATCEIKLDPNTPHRTQDDVWFVGNLVCDGLTQAAKTETAVSDKTGKIKT